MGSGIKSSLNMSETRKDSPYLVVAGIRDEKSLGWAAAKLWLDRDPEHKLVATVRSTKGQRFVEAQRQNFAGRIEEPLILDWTQDESSKDISEALGDMVGSGRLVSGVVHSVAGAPEENFQLPADEVDPEIYLQTIDTSAISLLRVIRGVRPNLTPGGGIVTFGYEEYGRVSEDYGGALSTAKVALSHLIKVQAVALGKAIPPARTLEIIPGFVDTYAGIGVALGIARKQGIRVKPSDLAKQLEGYFAESASLPNTTAEDQRQASGALSVDFIIGDSPYDQITGQQIQVNAGRNIRHPSIIPKPERVTEE